MNLFDYFNDFHVLSQKLRLSTDARSLYYAILSEFNRLQYPSELKLPAQYLQFLSGIKTESMLRSSKNALINANVISCKKHVYKLQKTGENPSKNGKPTENQQKGNEKNADFLISTTISKNNIEKEKEREEEITTTTATTRTREALSTNSEEVKQAWFLSEGETLKGGYAVDMIQLENAYGTEALVDAITAARRANTQPRLTYNFLKAVLERQQKGGKTNGRNNEPARSVANAESWEQQQPDWLD